MKIIEAHKKISRLVNQEDLERVYKESEKIFKILNKKLGHYGSFYAIAHPQVDDKDPLRFFVINEKSIEIPKEFSSIVVINPVIVKHTNQEIDSKEGCASFAFMPTRNVSRYNKIIVETQFLSFEKKSYNEFIPTLSKMITLYLSGKMSKIFQHEIDHLNAKYIYE